MYLRTTHDTHDVSLVFITVSILAHAGTSDGTIQRHVQGAQVDEVSWGWESAHPSSLTSSAARLPMAQLPLVAAAQLGARIGCDCQMQVSKLRHPLMSKAVIEENLCAPSHRHPDSNHLTRSQGDSFHKNSTAFPFFFQFAALRPHSLRQTIFLGGGNIKRSAGCLGQKEAPT
jgi:hypothetical protein